MGKKKKNIIWIVVDCVRNYQSGTDDRDKLDIMYELENEFTSFGNMMVSAPSSIMSAVNFFTGIPSYYLAGNYSQFQFDNDNYWTIKDILEYNGYKNYSILNARECRTMLTDLVDPIDNSFLTKDVRPTMMRWPNSEVTKIFYNLLDSKPQDPSFYFLWYNTRLDPNMSNEVKDLIANIKERKIFDDSIIILTADHGYPDRERGLVSDGWDLKQAGLRHDIILTNDNINVPFLIHYPGMKPKNIDTLVSTEDIVPTLLDILDIDLPFEKKLSPFGESLIPLIDEQDTDFFENRVIRSDARFSLQLDRNTSLQRQNYHYIVQHHDMKEELYDTANDPKEVNNIADDPKNKEVLVFFRNYFINENEKILKLQKESTYEKLEDSFVKGFKSSKEISTCYVIAFSQSYLYQTVVEVLKSKFPELSITLIIQDDSKSIVVDHFGEDGDVKLYYYKTNAIGLEYQKFSKKDLVIEVVDDPVSPVFRSMYDRFKNVSGTITYRVDWSGNTKKISSRFFNSPKFMHYKMLYRKIVDRLKLGMYEPTYFVNELKRMSKGLLKKKE